MPAKQRRSSPAGSDYLLKEAQALARRYRLRVGDAPQLARILGHVRERDAFVIHPDKRLAHLPLVIASDQLGFHHRETQRCGDDLWVSGSTTAEAGPPNLIGISVVDALADHCCYRFRGPVLIHQCGMSDGLHEKLSYANYLRVQEAHRDAQAAVGARPRPV
ncbi:hypothetical protein [Kitasatospora sp. NPDC059327]|uniref:hypothetical protein n=1 Tax=Kitasatospora sp. NPDC059327 TaxID=3346803 RepID=UPI0036CF5F47